MGKNENRNNSARGEAHWLLTKEKVLLCAGLVVIFYTMVIAPILGQEFHYEYLIAGLGLCGISITQWVDKK